ncbi:MAG: hypothetical protein RJA76_36 [Bacteroidota bacterium]|jgi:hypothetical protein
MGFFDFLKPKSDEQRKLEEFNKVRDEITIRETKSLMQEFIQLTDHDDSLLDINPNGIGKFGLEKTNPIPINGLDNLEAYLDKLRYQYISQKQGITTYNPVTYLRTMDNDGFQIGDDKPIEDIPASGIQVDNIKGTVDVYNLYSISNKLLAKIYINSYSLVTSNAVPEGFHHRDQIPSTQDSKVLIAIMAKNK